MKIITSLFLFALVFSCSEEVYIPKPPTHLKIDLPDHKYKNFIDSNRYRFEISNLWSLREKFNANDSLIFYLGKEIDGDLHFQYSKIDSTNSLGKLINQTFGKVDFHKIRAKQMIDTNFIFKDKKVFGTLFEFVGNSATNFQFYLTDSTENFVRSELLIRRTPNYDSLQPTLNYIKKDLIHLINSFEWKKQ